MKQNEIQSRLSQTETRIKSQNRKLVGWSNMRLLAAVVVVVGLTMCFRDNRIPGLILTAVAVVAFGYFVHRFNLTRRALELSKNELVVLGRYEARLNGEWRDFSDDGSGYINRDDFISTDLDIFGKGSLFQYISLAHTVTGRDALMRLLTSPDLTHINERQASVRELLADEDMAVQFEALGLPKNKRDEQKERDAEASLRSYALGEETANISYAKLIGRGLPVLTLLSIIGAATGMLSVMYAYAFFFLQLAAALLLNADIAREKNIVMTLSSRLAASEERLKLLQKPAYQSRYLVQMQKSVADAEQGIHEINRIVSLWQLRENFVFFWPLAGFLAWDFNCMLMLNRWREKYGTSFVHWMDWIGEAEALYSLGTLARVCPEDTILPTIVQSDVPTIHMVAGRHPLLKPETVVANDFSISGSTTIITGSNMSGKSTFMRSIAMNAVLAYAGGAVAAKTFDISPMRIFTSMRVSDDVGAGISTFYGEILRIKDMVTYAETHRPMLLLVDEIFKGTNYTDRIIGASAVIKKLSQPWIIGLIATHDFELCDLVENNEITGMNYHFEEFYHGDQISFDYTIRPGRCKTTNAQNLMRMAGLLDEQEGTIEKEGNVHVL